MYGIIGRPFLLVSLQYFSGVTLQGARGYDYELVLIQRKYAFWLPVNCSESECHLSFSGDCTLSCCFKKLLFQAPGYRLTKWSFYSTVLLQLCICNCVYCTQREFISMTRYTEVLLKHKREGLLKNLLQGSSISPHSVWGFILQVCLPWVTTAAPVASFGKCVY